MGTSRNAEHNHMPQGMIIMDRTPTHVHGQDTQLEDVDEIALAHNTVTQQYTVHWSTIGCV